MLLALDVHYHPTSVVTAGVGFADWPDAAPALELVLEDAAAPAPYQPGEFFRRELPYLEAMIAAVARDHALAAVVVDAHVWLQRDRPGLGAHLHAALGGRVAVIGVAKQAFHDGVAVPVVRGGARPLHVTAAGLDAADAAARVGAMAGPYRIPTLLKRADQLARRLVRPAGPSPSRTS